MGYINGIFYQDYDFIWRYSFSNIPKNIFARQFSYDLSRFSQQCLNWIIVRTFSSITAFLPSQRVPRFPADLFWPVLTIWAKFQRSKSNRTLNQPTNTKHYNRYPKSQRIAPLHETLDLTILDLLNWLGRFRHLMHSSQKSEPILGHLLQTNNIEPHISQQNTSPFIHLFSSHLISMIRCLLNFACIINQSDHMKSNATNQQPPQLAQLDAAITLLVGQTDTDENGGTQKALQYVFELLLWAQKKNNPILDTVFQRELLKTLLDKYPQHLQLLLSGMVLLLGNAKEGGPLISHVLAGRLGDRIITTYLQILRKLQPSEEEEHFNVLGSLLRVYHRHFNQTAFHQFIQNGRCLLIDVCCAFFNCPEDITRTSVMNIFMSLLQVPFIEQLLAFEQIKLKVGDWCKSMCCLFRNQLREFDQHLLITDQEESQFIINSINDKIILWEDLSSLNPQLFAPHFYDQLLLPLLLGSLNTTGVPLFTLKFALFVVNKLIPTISKLNLLPKLGSLLFEDKQISYTDDQLAPAILPPFSLKRLLEKESSQLQIETKQPNTFKHLNQLFMNVLRSKDGRFLECVCVLMVNLLSSVKKSPPAIELFVKKLGFGMGGATVAQISNIIITHFTAVHTLEITRIISALLIYIQPVKYLDETLKQRLVFIFRGAIEQALQSIQKQKQIHRFLAEVLEYDIRLLQSKQFSLQPVLKTDTALLFNNHIIENQALPFYQQLPETALQVTRYQIVKALFLRNVLKKTVEECCSDTSIERYVQKMRAIDAKYIKSGQNLRLPISVNTYRCKLQDSKVTIPTCLILDDDNNLIIGFCQNNNIRVISNFKYKHVYTEVKSKKDFLYIEISTSRYNARSQLMEVNKEFILRQLEVGDQYFRVKKNKVIAQEMFSICEILKHARKNLPEFSLI